MNDTQLVETPEPLTATRAPVRNQAGPSRAGDAHSVLKTEYSGQASLPWCPTSTVPAALGKPERCRQGRGDDEITTQLELARDQQPLGAGSTADQAQERHRPDFERQRRPALTAPRGPAPAVGERELVTADVAVSTRGDPELHIRVEARIRLCTLTDRAEYQPQQDVPKPTPHDRLEPLLGGCLHPPRKHLGL